MDAPKCKLCGERHYGLCGRAGQDRHIEAEAPRPRAQSPSASLDIPPPAKKFDRNAYHRNYMRDYMRKRRAKDKE